MSFELSPPCGIGRLEHPLRKGGGGEEQRVEGGEGGEQRQQQLHGQEQEQRLSLPGPGDPPADPLLSRYIQQLFYILYLLGSGSGPIPTILSTSESGSGRITIILSESELF